MKKLFAFAILFFLFTNPVLAAKFQSETASYKAPEIIGITKWFNAKDPIYIRNQRGKVVLLDFFTYSCINCIRTLPYLKELDAKYRDKGLVIVGVHSPEFDFEKNEKNVEKAIKKFGIKYAVAMDNNHATWNNFSNQFWPAHYLIDQKGNVVYLHFGEGEYDVLENNIRSLLEIAGESGAIKSEHQFSFFSQTPETYLGFARSQRNVNEGKKLTFPADLELHHWALEGKWTIESQYSEALAADASLRIKFQAKKVFLVMSSKDGKTIEAEITLNGKKLKDEAGNDVKNSYVKVNESRLYELVQLQDAKKAVLEIKAKEKGLRVYAFTFGD